MPPLRTSVKELAEFVHRRGDLHAPFQSTTLAEEGIARQRRWQQERGETYRREHPVAVAFGALQVAGRIDGWDPAASLVEEVKTTRTDVTALHRHAGAVHLAQLRLYAAMLALGDEAAGDEAAGELRLRLVYLHPDDAVAPCIFDESWQAGELIAFFEATCGLYVAWLDAVAARLAERDAQLRRLRFPYARFHPHQRQLAKRVFRGFRDGADWLVEAPTGSGKTMACVFPALKAMGEGVLDRLVFLTSRGTGQQAVQEALARVGADGAALASVTVTAKERICFNPGAPCDPESCSYSRGYFDRAPAARRELLARGLCRREDVEQVARRFEVCPFELSLEAAAWADVVVCDYNYVFDPVVRLKRLTAAPLPGARAGLVVDEAHQLGERTRAMLSARLERRSVKAALREGALAALRPRLKSIDRALGALAKAKPTAEKGDDLANAAALSFHEDVREIPPPTALRRALARFAQALPTAPVGLADNAVASDTSWQLLCFLRAMERAEDGAYRFLASGAGRDLAVEAVCTLPGEHIRDTMVPFHGTVRLSGTLTPPRLFQRLHGFEEESADSLHVAGSSEDRLGLFVVPDVPTYYRMRRRSLPALASLIDDVRRATPGNCLVAFPSFEYLACAADECAALFGEDVEWRRQAPDMEPAEREDFIRFLNEPDARRVGLVVAGGVFAESVDFDSDALRAVVVVGAGLPPRTLKRDLIASDSASDRVDGDEIAYRQPAMARSAQAVGRIARGSRPGVALLVDPRFAQAAYKTFFPARWQPRTLPAKAAGAAVREFWASAWEG